SLPSYNVTLLAREIVSTGGSIDVSGGGPSGAQPRAEDGGGATSPSANGGSGNSGNAGATGANSGNVTILAGTISGALVVTATGGAGQDGRSEERRVGKGWGGERW